MKEKYGNHPSACALKDGSFWILDWEKQEKTTETINKETPRLKGTQANVRFCFLRIVITS